MSAYHISRRLLLVSIFAALSLAGGLSRAAGPETPAGDLAAGRRALMSASILTETTAGEAAAGRPEAEFPARTAVAPAETGVIAFESNRGGDFDLWAQEAGGTGAATPVVASVGDDVTPEWSPDGSKLLYASDRDGDYEIYVRTLAGAEAKLTDNTFADVHPAWSPAGDRILFSSDRGGSFFQILSMRADGGDVHQVGSVALNHAMSPRLSPDGRRIVFMRATVAAAACQWNWDVWLMDADGNNQQRVTSRLGADLYPRWSPDGSRIVYASCRNLLDFDLYSIAAGGGSEQRLSSWFLKNEWAATYAPDGQHLAFSTDVDGNIEIYTMPAQGGNATNLTRQGGDDLAPSWKAAGGAPGFSISGQVLDASGRAIPCATVSAGPGHSTATDDDGNYTLTGLQAGSYAVTPSKPGYTFAPANRTLTGPPDAVGADFIASETTTRRPILVIPGMFASFSWQCVFGGAGCEPESWGWFTPIAESFYRPLLDQLAAAGYSETNGNLKVLFYDWRQPMATNVGLVRDSIQSLKAQTGAARVEVVGHSMGGLLGRAYVQSHSCAADVAHLITLGSPHRGAARAYPSWEGGIIYEGGWMGKLDHIAYALMLYFLGDLPTNTARLAVFRTVRSGQELLPIDDYLLDEENGDAPKPVASLHQRNEYLPQLEAGLPDLFARTDVSTLIGTQTATTTRFFVRRRPLLDWPLWEDGKPNWLREDEFDADGDGTVPANSARLPAPAHEKTFADVSHGDLPGDNRVRAQIFATLGIPMPGGAQWTESEAEPGAGDFLILALDGPAEVTVRSPNGGQAGPGGVTIAGAEYITIPGAPFRLLVVPAEEAGAFEIIARGNGAGGYRLGLLDTFSPDDKLPSDPMDAWDTVQGQMQTGAEVKLALSVAANMEEPPPLLAITPVIETPIRIGATVVHGWAQPWSAVEVRDADTGARRGSSVTDGEGRFDITLDAPLSPGRRLLPWANGAAGVPVEATLNMLYLPLLP
ncbi:MAG: carboxypeptidase regulatory-like domain-containing protein [Caldilineales bacterium]|nr:carboxypeptidase regulatory-like domain-containing protein [Caldilineales bacterium]MCW5857480.1 PD40 domain-containing protein [Caldilineales bacterium]